MSGIILFNICLISFTTVLFLRAKFNWITPFLVFVLGSVIFALALSVDNRRNEEIKKSIEKEISNELNNLSSRLELEVNRSAALIHGLSSFITINPNLSQEEFSEFASSLITFQSHILNFAGAPDLVVKYIYPIKGNEKVYDIKYVEIPDQKESVLLTLETKNVIIAGPVERVQGGIVFIGRVSTYTKDAEGNDVFWGVVSAPISIETLYRDAGVPDFQTKYRLAIKGKDGKGKEGEVFLGSEDLFKQNVIEKKVILPHGSWLIVAAPKMPWSSYNEPNYYYWSISWLFYGLMCVLLFFNAQTIINKQEAADQLRHSEELLRIMFENSPVGIALFDSNLLHTKTNKTYEQMLGYSNAEILQKDISHFNSSHHFNEEHVEISRLESQSHIGPYLKMIQSKNGTNRYLSVAGVQLITQKNEKILWLFFKDTTTEKLNEMKIIAERENAIQAKHEAEIAAKSKSFFLATMSHEIRTPINGIVASADLLTRGNLNNEQLEYVENIQRSSAFLLNIINDILDLAKLEDGKMQIEAIPVNLNQIGENISKSFMPIAEEKGIVFNFLIQDTFKDKFIISDPTKLNQILSNICSNAVKFTEKGSVTLHIKIEQGDIVLEVTDTGIGLDPEMESKIFIPFTQVDETITRRFGGTGLGLSICKNICNLMNGNILVKSELGKGSVFSVKLPLVWGQEITQSEHDQKIKSRNYNKTILLVDDNAINLKIGIKVLEKLGVKMVTATNGQEALDKLDSNPDLVLMDIQMPIMDGIQSFTKMRSIGFSKPILALTANVSQEDRDNYLSIGFDQVLYKPFKIDDLITALDKHFL